MALVPQGDYSQGTRVSFVRPGLETDYQVFFCPIGASPLVLLLERVVGCLLRSLRFFCPMGLDLGLTVLEYSLSHSHSHSHFLSLSHSLILSLFSVPGAWAVQHSICIGMIL